MSKTVRVSELVDIANRMLAATPDNWVGERQGIGGFISEVLMRTDNYRGFRYLATEYLPAEEQTPDNVLKPDYDDTRRHYSGGTSV